MFLMICLLFSHRYLSIYIYIKTDRWFKLSQKLFKPDPLMAIWGICFLMGTNGKLLCFTVYNSFFFSPSYKWHFDFSWFCCKSIELHQLLTIWYQTDISILFYTSFKHSLINLQKFLISYSLKVKGTILKDFWI